MVREGARRMLAAALEEEVSAFLGRERYERGESIGRSSGGVACRIRVEDSQAV